jgi:glycosyltransferase involved in cell wall biosynthesis
MKPIVLCFVAYYLPGYLAGGPIRTIVNLVEHLSGNFDFWIVTRDCDMGGKAPYATIAQGCWSKVGSASVLYLSPSQLSIKHVARVIRETPHDLLYLNSFFDPHFTLAPLIARIFRMCPKTPCLLAPRGELSSGALAIKKVKKRIYIRLAKTLRLYDNLYWQVSSDLERVDIIRELNSLANSIFIATDLTSTVSLNSIDPVSRVPGKLRLIFLSRISPMKNLDFLLRVLGNVSTCVSLAVYGPKEDIDYWRKCNRLLDRLPKNIEVTIGGHIQHSRVRDVFSRYDLFVFPTRGENFGHVIFEALSAGTPVLLSDRTPWKTELTGALQDLPLVEALWTDAITEWSKLDSSVLMQRRKAALEYAHRYSANSPSGQQNINIFRSVLTSSVPEAH